MKKVTKMIVMVVAALTVVSCNDNKPLGEQPSQLLLQGTALPLTRYEIEGGFEYGDIVGVYVVKHTAGTPNDLLSSGNYVDNQKFISANKDIESTYLFKPEVGEEVYWNSKDIFDIYSYFPYFEGIDPLKGVSYSVNTDQSQVNNYYKSDFLWSKVTNVEPKISPIQVDYKHLFSEVNISLYAGDGYSRQDLDDIVTGLKIKDVIVDASINISSGEVVPGTQRNTITAYRNEDLDVNYRAIVIPQEISSSKTFIEIQVGKKTYPVALDIKLVSGKMYRIELTINKDFSNTEMRLDGITWWDYEDGYRQEVTVINPIHSNIKRYCAVKFGSDFLPPVCFDGATIGSFECDPGKGSDYFDYAHNVNKRAEITNGMEMNVRFKNIEKYENDKYGVYAYADWNNDGDFLDANELVGVQEVVTGAQYSVQNLKYSLNIPANAVSPTTMRIYSAFAHITPISAGCGRVEGTVYDVPVYF